MRDINFSRRGAILAIAATLGTTSSPVMAATASGDQPNLPDITGIAVPGMPAGSPGMGGGAEASAKMFAWGGSAGNGQPFAFDD